MVALIVTLAPAAVPELAVPDEPQCANVQPERVGVGNVVDCPLITILEVGETLPPFASNVTV